MKYHTKAKLEALANETLAAIYDITSSTNATRTSALLRTPEATPFPDPPLPDRAAFQDELSFRKACSAHATEVKLAKARAQAAMKAPGLPDSARKFSTFKEQLEGLVGYEMLMRQVSTFKKFASVSDDVVVFYPLPPRVEKLIRRWEAICPEIASAVEEERRAASETLRPLFDKAVQAARTRALDDYRKRVEQVEVNRKEIAEIAQKSGEPAPEIPVCKSPEAIPQPALQIELLHRALDAAVQTLTEPFRGALAMIDDMNSQAVGDSWKAVRDFETKTGMEADAPE